jgi:hypothetical protein
MAGQGIITIDTDEVIGKRKIGEKGQKQVLELAAHRG